MIREGRSREIMQTFILLLAPFAPHKAEELWQRFGRQTTLAYEPWPGYDPKFLVEEQSEMAVTISGKVRAKITVSKNLGEVEIRRQVLADPRIKPWIEGRQIRQVIVVPGRIVNIVTSS